MSQSNLSLIENGHQQVTGDRLELLAHALDTTPENIARIAADPEAALRLDGEAEERAKTRREANRGRLEKPRRKP